MHGDILLHAVVYSAVRANYFYVQEASVHTRTRVIEIDGEGARKKAHGKRNQGVGERRKRESLDCGGKRSGVKRKKKQKGKKRGIR